ncbi:MAG TPA: anthranilate synthase component I family protein, partial [Thermoanaerobaculia bacterium]|nr:anthranilate synthase component I family protein [Thermoanaerobaculia bacterium]
MSRKDAERRDPLARARTGRLVPVVREFSPDGLTPLTLFRRMRRSGEECFLLESVEGGEAIARYTVLGVAPSARLTARGPAVEIEREGQRRPSRLSLLPALDALTLRDRFDPDPDLPPLCGGAVGFLGYDAARLFENIPDRHPREDEIPDALFLRFDSIVAFDHARGRLLLTTAAEEEETRSVERRLDRLQEFLDGEDPVESFESSPAPDFAPTMPRKDFLGAVDAAKEAILAGEIYQVVLSQRWTAPLAIDPLDVYDALRRLNPSPYLFYLETREASVFGASPEMLVRCRGRVVETRPIAGTIRRGADPEEDARLAAQMLADPKERAEHVMLVDLGRNDLGRVCEIGSVHVARYAEIERYSHVQHLVSDVRGTLARGMRSTDALASCFPAGTLTGAPKIRAMEVIDELECCRRGIYGGAVGYLDHSGNLDMAIAIRTAVVESGNCRIQAGAGIVADSIAENEYREAESKA